MKSLLFKKVTACAAALAVTMQLGLVLPASASKVQLYDDTVTREYTQIYSQNYEDVADTAALKNIWASASYADGITLGTDNTNYAQYTDGTQNTRSATSNFSVDLTDYDKYAVEFDLALTKSTKDDVQFVLATGTMPTNNSGMSSEYIFKINMTATTNNCTINDVSTATVTLTDSAWYHYTILVDEENKLATVTITDANGTNVVDKLLVPTVGTVNNKITGILFVSGRYNSVMKLDNILVRTTDQYDEFAEKGEETLAKVEFVSQLDTTVNQPEENQPVHKEITAKAIGIYGGDLTDKCEFEWSVDGLANEDGYISLTAEEGTGAGTEGETPTGKTAYFNVRNGVSNWFGQVNVKVSYLEEEMTISTPFAVIGASGAGNYLAPAAGYPVDMSDYDDDLVGFKATSTAVNSQDLVLNKWSIYGSNGTRTLTLNKDEDGTKYLRFAINGGSGSTVGVYQLAEQASQYIVDMKVRFTGAAMTFGHYFNTPNNTDGNPNWTVTYGSNALTVGTETISGLNATDWFRIVVSADESAGTFWAKVYDKDGALVGEAKDQELASTSTAAQKYFCFYGTYPVDLASFKIYYPTAASLTINADKETVQVPEATIDPNAPEATQKPEVPEVTASPVATQKPEVPEVTASPVATQKPEVPEVTVTPTVSPVLTATPGTGDEEVSAVLAADEEVTNEISYKDGKVTVKAVGVQKAVLLYATYNVESGILESIVVKDIVFDADGVAEYEVELAEGVKVMVWDSLDGAKPICASYDVAKAEEPTTEPTATATVEPTATATTTPTAEPTVEPTAEPTAEPKDDNTVSLSGVLKDIDGYSMTGKITWSLDEEYAGVTLEDDGTQGAKLTVTSEAGAGTVTVIATYGSTRAEKAINLSTSGNAMAFTKYSSSMTIPFAGEDSVTAEFAAEARNKDGEAIADTTVTYEMVDAAGEAVSDIRGVTFDPETGILTVEPGAASKVVYIKATSQVDDETLTSRVKVNIHGLSFAFGSTAPEDDSYTQVTAADAYTDKLGYGFADTTSVTNAESNVTGSADYRFKVKVPNGNYVVNVTTSAASMKSEVVESVTATTGISKSGSSFKVAVCDGVLDLTFPSGSTLTNLVVTQDAAKTKLEKPALYAIGDSTTNNNANGQLSWGNTVGSTVTLPETFSSFSNNGMAGRDSVSFYNQARVEDVLLNVCPGDYVTVNMGINSKETNEGASFYTLVNNYYVQGIIQRGAIPVIVTATPLGFSDKQYPYSNGVFTVNRGLGAQNGTLRKIAQENELNIIELSYYFEDYFNSLTDEDVAAYNEANGTSYTSVIELVKSWYGDHNHTMKPLAEKIAVYILDSVDKIANGSTDFYYENDTHINEQ